DRIQRVKAFMPIVAAKLTLSQTQLHDVEELAIAGIDLDLAIVQDVVRAANPGCDLIAPAEVDGWESIWIVCRIVFVVEAHADVEREPRILDRPGILEI